MRVARSRRLVAEGYPLATVARVLTVSRQALYRAPKPRRSPQRRPPRDVVEETIVEVAAAASELEHVGLAEALDLLLLIRDQEPAKFERAALRWHARFCREVRGVEAGEALAVLALLAVLAGKRGKPAARALAELLHRRGTEPACEVLMRWGGEPAWAIRCKAHPRGRRRR